MKYYLIYLGVIIQLLFYISAYRTGWFNGLFTGNSIHHCCRGMDFYQVPNGAYSFWRQGDLTGKPLPNGFKYSAGHFANLNVYHPLFTLTIGSWLIQFNPDQAFYAWMFLKLVITLAVTGYFFWSFRESKYVNFAVFVLLANCTQYLEIAIGQFHAILNAFLLLLLVNLVKRRNSVWGGLLYCLTLLVKPIGLLWLWIFLCKQRFRVAFVGLGMFVVCTGVFLFNGSGSYYMTNLMNNILYPIDGGPNQIITLAALLHYSTSWPDIVLKGIQYAVLVIVFFFSSLKRVHISKGIFLAVVYYLLFYDLVFEYHYTSLAPVIAVCIVCCPEFQTRLSRVLVLLTCLPSAFALLNYWHIDVKLDSFFGPNPGALGWQWMVVSKVVPVILLVVTVMVPDAVPAYKQLKVFWISLRKLNGELGFFG